MKRAVLAELLRSLPLVATEGEKTMLPEGLRVDLIATAGTDALPISGVRELTLGELYIAATTDKDETYYVEYEQVVGLRTKGRPVGSRNRAGFSAS